MSAAASNVIDLQAYRAEKTGSGSASLAPAAPTQAFVPMAYVPVWFAPFFYFGPAQLRS